MITVDIAVPCYNYGRFLRDCVESILTQSFSSLRVLIIDNASTDHSLQVARRLAAEDPRVEIRAHDQNLGPHASYNAGVDWATGDYFFLLDADDLLTPGSLERGVAIMEENSEVAMAYGAELCLPLREGAKPEPTRVPAATVWETMPGTEFVRRLCRDPQNTIGGPTVLRRVTAQKRIGHYRPSLPYTDDLEMWLRLATVGRVAVTRTPQGIRRLHGAQATQAYRETPIRDFVEHRAAFESFFAHEGAALPEARRLLHEVRRTIGTNAYWYGMWRRREGDSVNAALCVQYGLQLNPLITGPRLLKQLVTGGISLADAKAYLTAFAPVARQSAPEFIRQAPVPKRIFSSSSGMRGGGIGRS